MNTGNKKNRMSMTDFARFLNVHSDRFPETIPFLGVYMTRCNRARRDSIRQFGFWLRDNHRGLFGRLYKRAKQREDEILAEAYDSIHEES